MFATRGGPFAYACSHPGCQTYVYHGEQIIQRHVCLSKECIEVFYFTGLRSSEIRQFDKVYTFDNLDSWDALNDEAIRERWETIKLFS